jgi:Flp pilus assembly protein TadB
MRTAFYLIITCFISTFSLFGALCMKNPFPCFGIAFGIWALFLLGCQRRYRKQVRRQMKQQQFNDFLHSISGKNQQQKW